MKTLKRIYTIVLITSLVSLTSCHNFLDVNVDPNNPTEVSVDLLLTSAQSYIAYNLGGDVNRYAGLFVQHYAGVQGQSQEEFDIYNFGDDETDNLWRFGFYAGGMADLKVMIDQAKAEGSPHYEGVGMVLMAHALGIITDHFGRVPYNDAFKLQDNIKPAYDNQQDLYNLIQTDLDAAIGLLTAAESAVSPGTDDLMFSGDLNQWVKFANFLKIRYYNHKGKQDPTNSANQVLALLDSNSPLFGSNGDDAEFPFYASPNAESPLFQFEAQRGQIAVSKTMLDDHMTPLNDPRIPQYALVNGDGEYVGAPNGSALQDQSHVIYSAVGPFWASANSPVSFGGFFEQKFIEAEAAMRANDQGRAYTAYLEAIKANFDKYGIAEAEYDTYVAQAEVDPGQAGLTTKHIMVQKYIAMFSQGGESWTDWRRTGFPEINPSDNNLTNGVIPVRFPYPNSEVSLNGENVPAAGLTDPVWFQDGTED